MVPGARGERGQLLGKANKPTSVESRAATPKLADLSQTRSLSYPEAAQWMREAGVPDRCVEESVNSFTLDTIQLKKAGENGTIGFRYYSGAGRHDRCL